MVFSTICVVTVGAAAPDYLTVVSPAEGDLFPLGSPVKAVFALTAARGDFVAVKVQLDGKDVVSPIEAGKTITYNNLNRFDGFIPYIESAKAFWNTTSVYPFVIDIPQNMLTAGRHQLTVIVEQNENNTIVTKEPAVINFTVKDIPVKVLNAENDLNTFATVGLKNYVNSETGLGMANDGGVVTVETVSENNKALNFARSASETPLLKIYVKGNAANNTPGIEDANRLVNDRLIVEMDIKPGQANAFIKIQDMIGAGSNFEKLLFRNDGTIGESQKYKYSAGEWRHLRFDLDYVTMVGKLYCDGAYVENYDLSANGGTAGISKMTLAIGSTTVAGANFSIDNLKSYTVAPYSTSVENEIDYHTIPAGTTPVVVPLNGAFNNAVNVATYVTLTKDSNVVAASVSYDATTNKITITPSEKLQAGEYSINYGSGLTMTQTKGSTNNTEINPLSSYSEKLYVVDTGKISLDSVNKTAEIYYNSPADGTVSFILATFDANGISKIEIKPCEVTTGYNYLTVSINDENATSVRAFLWSDMENIIPLAEAK